MAQAQAQARQTVRAKASAKVRLCLQLTGIAVQSVVERCVMSAVDVYRRRHAAIGAEACAIGLCLGL